MKNGIVIIVSIAIIVFCTLYILSTFSYKISEGKIVIKWKLFKYIPFNSTKIDLDIIEAIRFFDFKNDFPSGGHIWGNLFIKKGVIIEIKRGLFKKYYITPDNPIEFIKEVSYKMSSLQDTRKGTKETRTSVKK